MSPGHSFLESKAPAMPVRVFNHDLTADARESGNQVPKSPWTLPDALGHRMLDLGHEPLAGECVVERLGELPPETSNTENCENPDIPEHFSQVLKMVFSTVTLKSE